MNSKEKIILPNQIDILDKELDLSLRPKTLNEYIGQDKIKENLNISIIATKQRGEPLEHVLIYGPPGLGKTTLSHIISHELGTNIKVTSGPALEHQGDLASILSNLEDGDILFIDEIHRLNRTVEEILYPAMEDYALDLVLGKGPSAKTMRIDLPKFTLIGATTRIGLISSPLRGRFGHAYHLDFYGHEDIAKIIKRSSLILGFPINQDCLQVLAQRSRKTPRIANRLLRRVRDFSQVKTKGVINKDIMEQALDMLDIDQLGLDTIDRKIIQTIAEKFSGGPVGIKTIAAAISEEIDTIEDVYEPYLLQIGFLNRTPKGRVLTDLAYQHLGKNISHKRKLF